MHVQTSVIADPSKRQLPHLELLGMSVEVILMPGNPSYHGVVLAVGMCINLIITNSN